MARWFKLAIALVSVTLMAGCTGNEGEQNRTGFDEWVRGDVADVRVNSLTAQSVNETMKERGATYSLSMDYSIRWHNGSKTITDFYFDMGGGGGELAREAEMPQLAERGVGQVTTHSYWVIPRWVPNHALYITIQTNYCEGTKEVGGWQGSETVGDCTSHVAQFLLEPELVEPQSI